MMLFHRKSKGAYLAIEQMILFGIGIVVLIGIGGVYSSMQSGTKALSVEDQFREVAELTLTHVLYVYNAGSLQDANATNQFDIPPTLADQAYEIRLRDNDIFIISLQNSNTNYTLSLLGINESFAPGDLSGTAMSGKSKVKVNYNRDEHSISIQSV